MLKIQFASESDFWAEFRYYSEINPDDPSASQNLYKKEGGGGWLFKFISFPPLAEPDSPTAEPWFCPACTAAPAQPFLSHCHRHLSPASLSHCRHPKPPPASELQPPLSARIVKPWSHARKPWFVCVQDSYCIVPHSSTVSPGSVVLCPDTA